MWICGARLRANRVFIAVMAAGIDCARIEAVARTVVAAEAGYNNLKQELVQAVVEFFRWRDVFVSLLATASLSSMGFCLGHSASTGTAEKYVKCFGY